MLWSSWLELCRATRMRIAIAAWEAGGAERFLAMSSMILPFQGSTPVSESLPLAGRLLFAMHYQRNQSAPSISYVGSLEWKAGSFANI